MIALLAAFTVAVTVDDLPAHGPDTDRVAVTRKILAAFRKHRLPPVIGFVNRRKLEGHPELEEVLRLWRAEGNPLGNHGYAHLSLTATAPETYVEDIARNEREDLAKVYRYPFLFEGDTLEKRHFVRDWLAGHGYRIAQVTIDGDDWAWNPPYTRCAAKGDQLTLGRLRQTFLDAHAQMIAFYVRLARELAGRDVAHILLLHVGAMDADQMDALLSTLEAQGARFVTLEEAMGDPIYGEAPDLAWKVGASLLDRMVKARGLKPAYPQVDEKWLESACR